MRARHIAPAAAVTNRGNIVTACWTRRRSRVVDAARAGGRFIGPRPAPCPWAFETNAITRCSARADTPGPCQPPPPQHLCRTSPGPRPKS